MTTAKEYELRLKIDAQPAQQGSRQFVAAIAAVKKAVADLDRDATGAFTKLRNVRPEIDVTPLTRATTETDKLSRAATTASAASDRAADHLRRMAITSANALRISTDQASRLRDRLLSVGDVDGLARVNVGLAQLRTNLTNATSALDIREARAGYADLASELNRTARESERLRAEANAQARAQDDAARSADAQAASLRRLRAAHDPLFAASQQYENALREIDALVTGNMMTEEMATGARERAAQSYLSLGGATDRYAVSAGQARAAAQQMGYQVNDVITMAAMGASPMQVMSSQIFQISQAMELAGGKAKALSSIRTALMGLVSPTTLAVGAVIALTTAVVQWGLSAIGAASDTQTFAEALSRAESNIRELQTASGAMGARSLADLRREYAMTNDELAVHLDRLRQIAEFNARNTNADLAASLREGITSDGNPFTTDLDATRRLFETTSDSARIFLSLLGQIGQAGTFREQAEALTRAREHVERLTGGLGRAEGEAGQVLVQLMQAEDAALRLAAAGENSGGALRSASGAAGDLTYTIGTAANEAARLLANLGSVPGALAAMGRSVAGQIQSIQAMNRSLTIQLESGISSEAANRRVQLMDLIQGRNEAGQRLNFDEIAAAYQEIEALDAAVREGEALREQLREANAPARQARRPGGGGGGSRTAALTEEQQATQTLNETLRERLQSLQNEQAALRLVASGQFENVEAANLYAEAARLSGGAVDEQTAAMIRQIDAAQSLNAELTRMAHDPVREWMDSVPNWIEAGQQIEMGVIDGLKGAIRDLITTGEFDIEKLGETILGVIADVVADKAVQELWSLFGRSDAGSSGLGGLLGGLFENETPAADPGAGMVAGSQQAGQNIQSAMVQGGQQVAQTIQQAMQTGAQQVQTGAQSGLTAGAAQVRTAGQTGMTAGAMQVRSASMQGAQQMQQGVVAGSQQGAQILASGVASGAGGGGGGGLGGIFSMILGGLFSEGGYSTSAVSHAPVAASAFRGAPHYSQGTPNTSGIPAILHPNEAVIPLSRGRKIPVDLGDDTAGGPVFNQVQNFTINTPDADSFRRSKKEIAAEMAASGQRALRQNR